MRFRIAAELILVLAVTLSLFSANAEETNSLFQRHDLFRQTWGAEWETPEMRQTLDELQSLGANSFAIHPYARISNDGHVRFRTVDRHRHITSRWTGRRSSGCPRWSFRRSLTGDRNSAGAAKSISSARKNGTISFDDYEVWILDMARSPAHDAAIFCVGLEFTHAQKFTERWPQIIAAVRAVYFGKLTYGANWNEYERVKFWDALDYRGSWPIFP